MLWSRSENSNTTSLLVDEIIAVQTLEGNLACVVEFAINFSHKAQWFAAVQWLQIDSTSY